jgi:hypothetical protein
VPWRDAQLEAVADVARHDVEVDVKDFLARGFAVGEEKIDAFAAQPRRAQGRRDRLTDAKHMRAVVSASPAAIAQKTHVLVGSGIEPERSVR